jgi:calcineurin-like phosphoesterase family protein
MRELREETAMYAYNARFLFRYMSGVNRAKNGKRWRDHHTVCLVKAFGKPRPRHEIKHIAYYTPGCNVLVSKTTKAIIDKYLSEKSPPESRNNGKIYVVSDLHLEHDNIISYCQRPFNDSVEMNKALINGWNDVLNDEDKIFFLGDFAPFKKIPRITTWMKQLSGNIVTIQGSHDPDGFGIERYILDYGGFSFLLVHAPVSSPKHETAVIPHDWTGWVIHGHTHNNDMINYPFINGLKKTINVSVELTGYRPVSLDFLISLGLDNIRRMDTVDSVPDRF